MTTVYDHSLNRSDFVVWDAKSLEQIARYRLDDRVPNGFHTMFVTEEELS